MKIKTSELTGAALDWAVAKALGILRSDNIQMYVGGPYAEGILPNGYCPVAESAFDIPLHQIKYSTDWSKGGPIIERENITLIRANSQYIEGKYVPLWFAETDKWVGHNITIGYEGEYFDPCFMIDEAGGCYGPTPLIAAMRAFVALKLGDEVDVPDELLGD